MAGRISNYEKKKYEKLFFNELEKPEIYRDKYLILLYEYVFHYLPNDQNLAFYIKSNFNKKQYNSLIEIINLHLNDEIIDIDSIYCFIKSVSNDFTESYFRNEQKKNDELIAYRHIISEPEFNTDNCHFETIKKFIESNLSSTNLSKRDLCEIDYTLSAHQLFMNKSSSIFEDFKKKHRKRLVLFYLVIKHGWGTGYKIYRDLNKPWSFSKRESKI